MTVVGAGATSERNGGGRPWEEVRLQQLVTITSGQSPSSFRFGASGIPYFKVEQLNSSSKYLTRRSTPYLAIDAPTVPAGSVVFAKRGAAISLNRIRILGEPAFMDTNLMALTPRAGLDPELQLDPEFLYYSLQHRGLWDIADITSIPQINNKHINPLKIALPCFREQLHVTEMLRTADESIGTIERLIRKEEAIREGLVHGLTSGRLRLPSYSRPWQTTTLGALGAFIKGRGIKREDVTPSGVPCVRYGELYTTYRDYTTRTVSFVSEAAARDALPLRTGDILFAGSGETRAEIGICIAYVGDTPAVAGGDIVVLRPVDVDPVFLALLANSPSVAAAKARAGQGDAVVHISSRSLGRIEVQLPSDKEEQAAIARVVIDADRAVGALRARLLKARSLKTGLAQALLGPAGDPRMAMHTVPA